MLVAELIQLGGGREWLSVTTGTPMSAAGRTAGGTMNVLIEMTALAVGRPTVDDPPGRVAAWYRAKARLHAYLAEQGGPDADQEAGYAATADEHARALLRATAGTNGAAQVAASSRQVHAAGDDAL